MSTSSGLIDPAAIPGDELDPDGVIAAADALAADGAAVRDHGAAAVTNWRSLASVYEAPEAAELFAVMDPVETKSRDFGDGLWKVAAALRAYAEAIRPIKSSLARVRTDAQAFRRKIASDPDWQENQRLVDANTDLVERVNAQQVALWEAERTCANAIRALYCAAPWHAMTSENDPVGYGLASLPVAAAMPWGSAVKREDRCPKSAAVQVKRFVWDGVVVDGLWGTVTGLAAFAGFRDWRYSNATLRETWTGMADLFPLTVLGVILHVSDGDGLIPAERGIAAWQGLGKGMVSWDTWEDDPSRAAGGAVFNIATIFLPAGAAVSGTKGAASAANAASKGARVSAWLARGAEVVDWVDPLSATAKGAQFLLPRLDDLASGLRVAGDLDAVVKLDVPEAVSTLDEIPGAAKQDEFAVVVRDVETVERATPETSHTTENTHAAERQLVGTDGRTIDSQGDASPADRGGSGSGGERPSLWESRGGGGSSGSDEPPVNSSGDLGGPEVPRDGRSLAEDVAERFPDKTLHAEVSGQKGAWNETLNDPQPNSVYIVDGRSVFVTDELGRVEHVEAHWEPTNEWTLTTDAIGAPRRALGERIGSPPTSAGTFRRRVVADQGNA